MPSVIFLFSICIVCFQQSVSYALATKQAGDLGRYAVPVTSALVALGMRDLQGIVQLGLATGVVQGTTEGLKSMTDEHRPNGGCCRSFPSGHTSAAFTGAAFIHFRYGFIYSIPFYAASTFVGYSRVQVKAHYIHDVAFGAALGVLGTYLSTTPYQPVSCVVEQKYAGIIYRKIFD